MPVADFGTYRSARLLMRLHGADAAAQATDVAQALLASGDPEGLRIWTRIGAAIEQLQQGAGARSPAAPMPQDDQRQLRSQGA